MLNKSNTNYNFNINIEDKLNYQTKNNLVNKS